MKIAIACFSTRLGLSENEAINYFSSFAKIQPTVMFIKKDSQIEHELKRPEFKKNYSKIESFNFQSDWSPFFIMALRDKIYKLKIDVIILFNIAEAKSMVLATKGLGVKLILRQDQFIKDHSSNWLDQIILEKIDAFVPASQHFAAQLNSSLLFKKHKSRATMIYHGVNYNALSIQQSYEEKNLYIKQKKVILEILQEGDIQQSSGQFEALIAVKSLKDSGFNFKLTFVGDIVDEAYYQKMLHYLKEYNLSSHIHFAGKHKDAKQFYQNAHILICPGRNCEQTNLYIDALAHGLPILAFESSAFLELQLLGFKVHLASDQKALNTKLESMALNVKKILRLAMDGNPTLVQEYFSPEVIMQQWIQLIRSLDASIKLKCS
jgi:glycosyltransferase involved in cell wall biosynthesis